MRLEVTGQIPKEIKLGKPSYTQQRRSSYGSSSYYDTRPFTRNHRQKRFLGAELHTAGLNLEDQLEIRIDH